MTVFSTQDKNKAMPQRKRLVIGLFSLTVALSGCATDGNYYRSDVYSSSQVNQAQRVNTVEIIAINPAQVAVNNSENSDRARATGAILGAIAGAAIGNHNNHSTSSRVLGGLAGGAIGGLARRRPSAAPARRYVDGACSSSTRSSDGRVLPVRARSAASRKNTELGSDHHGLVHLASGETRIQPNNPYGCGKR